MRWSWKLGEFAGIGVFVHATFVLLIGWIAIAGWLVERSASGAAASVAFLIALFACVLLHEFGHALAARRYGIATRDITLLPIGGVARLERIPDDPRQELWVALAGPAVNVVIAALLFVALGASGGFATTPLAGLTEGGFLQRLLGINVFLAAFNMLPAFPMDGGRVLRALLAMRADYVRSTQAAALIGQAMALLFAFLGLMGNPLLLFVALFVWIGASQEASMAQMKAALGGIPVDRAMQTDFRVLDPHDPLARAVEALLAGPQQDFPVVSDGQVLGVLTRDDILRILAQRDESVTVGQVMRREFELADAAEMLEIAFQRLQSCTCHSLPVLHRGRLVGVLTADNVGDFMMIQAAVRRRADLTSARANPAS